MGTADRSVFVAHYLDAPDAMTPAEAVAAAPAGAVLVTGVVERHPGTARMCDLPPSVEHGPWCGPDAPAVLGWGAGIGGEPVYALSGEFLVRAEGGALAVDTVGGAVREWVHETGGQD